ncbi:hypothetical protein BaRGS_00032198, partial [Batillaria attramentaria]
MNLSHMKRDDEPHSGRIELLLEAMMRDDEPSQWAGRTSIRTQASSALAGKSFGSPVKVDVKEKR